MSFIVSCIRCDHDIHAIDCMQVSETQGVYSCPNCCHVEAFHVDDPEVRDDE